MILTLTVTYGTFRLFVTLYLYLDAASLRIYFCRIFKNIFLQQENLIGREWEEGKEEAKEDKHNESLLDWPSYQQNHFVFVTSSYMWAYSQYGVPQGSVSGPHKNSFIVAEDREEANNHWTKTWPEGWIPTPRTSSKGPNIFHLGGRWRVNWTDCIPVPDIQIRIRNHAQIERPYYDVIHGTLSALPTVDGCVDLTVHNM